jgi:hypothetical protein
MSPVIPLSTATFCELGHAHGPDTVVVDKANPVAVTPDIIYDKNGEHPVKVWLTVVKEADVTHIWVTVDADQFAPVRQVESASTSFTGTGGQLFGVCDKWGNPRAGLELRPFAGAPGETVRIAVTVDDLPPATITIPAVDGVPMEHPAPNGDARRFVHLPGVT